MLPMKNPLRPSTSPDLPRSRTPRIAGSRPSAAQRLMRYGFAASTPSTTNLADNSRNPLRSVISLQFRPADQPPQPAEIGSQSKPSPSGPQVAWRSPAKGLRRR